MDDLVGHRLVGELSDGTGGAKGLGEFHALRTYPAGRGVRGGAAAPEDTRAGRGAA